MKTKFFLPLLFLLFLSNIVIAQKKIALIIAIGKYENVRWKNLSSLNDLRYIKEALIKNSFLEKNIDTLINNHATKANMLKAIDALIAKAAIDDVVYLHFSGHGQQLQDDDGDEVDGYDETLIPYDAKGVWDPVDYHGEKHFRDDLLEEKLKQLRKKVGKNGSVVVVIDACHSGTITRGEKCLGIERGDPIPCQAAGYKPKLIMDAAKKQEFGLLEGFGNDMGVLVAFSGSSPNQTNKEMKDEKGASVGSLSFAFAKALNNLPENANYKLLFEKVKATIQTEYPSQIPMFEGNDSLNIFSNKYTPISNIITAEMRYNNADFGYNDTTFVIAKGILNNYNVGTTFNVYKTGEKEIYCNAIITQANNFQSICIADKRMYKGSTYEVKVNSLAYGAITTTYGIVNNTTTNTQLQQLEHYFKVLPYISKSTNPDYTISLTGKANMLTISVISKTDSVIYIKEMDKKQALSNDILEEIEEQIKLGMRIKYLRKIQDGGSYASKVKVEIVPIKKQQSNNELVFYAGDEFNLVITNNSDEILYYTILDLLPNNTVKVLVPDGYKIPADYALRKGQSVTDSLYTDTTSVTGKEIMKIIVSPIPLDLKTTFEKNVTRKLAAKGLEKTLDDLFPKNKKISTRTAAVKMDEIGILSVGFTILNSKRSD